ncbi:unnamed protein product [Sympodiomycopsis kandeliae]
MTVGLDCNGNGNDPLSRLPVLSQVPGTGTSGRSGRSPRVLIVGGGPAGLVTLRNFTSDESSHPGGKPGLDAVLYERREEIGGVWYLDPHTLGLEEQKGYTSHNWPLQSCKSHPRFPSPAYPALVGNVFPRFVSFSGLPFPELEREEQFPTLQETFNYLEDVAAPLRSRIKTKKEVKEVWELPSLQRQDSQLPSSGGWLLHTHDHSTVPPTSLWEHFDAVTFAPSFTTHANWPDIPGLGTALTSIPSRIHHAKWYRTPEPFWRAKRVVVVGNGLSTNDIAAQIASRRKSEWGEEIGLEEEPIRRAIRHEAVEMFPSLPDDRILEVPYITKIDVTGQRMDLTLADGSVIPDVDHLILGTGYQAGIYDWVHVLRIGASQEDLNQLAQCGLKRASHSSSWELDIPALKASGILQDSSLWTPLTPPARHPTRSSSLQDYQFLLSTSTSDLDKKYPRRVPHLHSHVLNSHNPSLSFSSLTISFAPFVLSDLSSRYIRSVWQGDTLLSNDLTTRRQAELQRWQLLSTRSKELALNTDKNASNLPPSSLLAYHILGTSEWPFQQYLYRSLIEAKPWLKEVSGLRPEEWTEERDTVRRGMYNVKKEWLLKREEMRKESVKALVQNAVE